MDIWTGTDGWLDRWMNGQTDGAHLKIREMRKNRKKQKTSRPKASNGQFPCPAILNQT